MGLAKKIPLLGGTYLPKGEALWEGSLGEFPLSSVLQTLGRIRATGILHISPLGVGIYFRTGLIQAVEGLVPLGDLLVLRNYTSESQLEAALESSIRPLGQALLALGLEPESLKEGLEIQAQLSLALLLAEAAEQRFAFFPQEPLPSPEAGLEPSPLLMEWAARTLSLPLGTPMELAPAPGPVHLDADEWQLIHLTNGRRTLGSILRFSGLAPRVAWQKAEGLLQRGLLRPSALWGLRLIVPERAPRRTNYHPPSSLMANLFLKWTDGVRSAAAITQGLGLSPQEGALHLADLFREGLIQVRQGHAEMAKLLEEF